MPTKIAKSRLSHLMIRLPSGRSSTRELYANGRHQCEVIIEVVKETQDKKGAWNRTLLTEQERASLTVCALSADTNGQLQAGWSCDKERNEFELGLWNPQQENKGEEPLEAPQRDTNIECFHRYMRAESLVLDQSATFIARVEVGGQFYTTHSTVQGVVFESMVTIRPTDRYYLEVDDLEELVDEKVVDLPGKVRIDTYYWSPKDPGLKFFVNLGLEKPVPLEHEGSDFLTSFFENAGEGIGVKAGVIDYDGIVGYELWLSAVHQFDFTVPALSIDIYKALTAMRAFRVSGLMSENTVDSESSWFLLDNKGNRHQFFLFADGDRLSVRSGRRPAAKIAHLKITLSNGGDFTNALYANSRQTYKVLIEAIKQHQDPDGRWVNSPLTAAERASVTVVPFSQNPNQPLPAGWSCDELPSKFDEGLWAGAGVAERPEQGGTYIQAPGTELIERFMRVDEGTPVSVQRFMARITVWDKVYTTNYVSDDDSFYSYVDIQPTRPYDLPPEKLTSFVDIDAYNDFDWVEGPCDMDVYYWLPPVGLKFRHNYGLENPVRLDNHELVEGGFFQTTYVYVRSGLEKNFRAGVLFDRWERDIPATMYSIQRKIFTGDVPVPINKRDTLMRAVRIVGNAYTGSSETFSRWTLIDNYGCRHAYKLYGGDQHNLILLISA